MTSTTSSRLPVIVGLDALEGNLHAVESLVQTLCGRVLGFKVGLPGMLAEPRLGPTVRGACADALLVADLKLADIGDTMVRIARHAPWADAVIAHAFPGYEGAVDRLAEYLAGRGQRLVLVVAMSNPGARETMDPVLEKLVAVARRAGAWGLVAPATRPSVVARVRSLMPEAFIMAPGVGAQGAQPGSALRAGADAEIVGRAITMAGDPVEALERLAPHYR